MDSTRSLAPHLILTPAQESALAASAAILVSICFPASRLLTGSIINFLLVLGVLRRWTWPQLAPVILLPVMAASTLGWLALGSTGMWLMLLWPVVWTANFSLVATLKLAQRRWNSYLLALLPIAAGIKLGVIVLGCLLLAHMVPALPQIAALPAGQWIAALIGGAGAMAFQRLAHRAH